MRVTGGGEPAARKGSPSQKRACEPPCCLQLAPSSRAVHAGRVADSASRLPHLPLPPVAGGGESSLEPWVLTRGARV